MIEVEQAVRRIRDTVQHLPEEAVPLADASGRVLCREIVAPRDVPPFDRVMMDGMGLAHAAIVAGRTTFQVAGEVAAGHPPMPLLRPETDALSVMTGAVLPPGCDCVIPIEDLETRDGAAHLREGVEVRAGQFIHRQGSDRPRGDVLVEAGSRLNAARIGIAASAGCAELTVSRRPVIGIVSNGDELIDVGNPIESHQIHPSNRYALRAALLERGLDDLHIRHLPDDESVIERELRELLAICDVTILSGGVSAGAYDYIPGVLDRLRVRRIFHKVRQRPGKPMWFGLTERDTPVFALPGNPVSTFICFYRYVLPHLEHMQGAESREHTAVLGGDLVSPLSLTGLLPVLESDGGDGHRRVDPIAYQGSGDLTSLDRGTGFVELAAGQKEFPAGTVIPYYPWT